MRYSFWKTAIPVWLVVMTLVGCSKEDFSGLVNKAKETAVESTAKVKQAVSEKLEGTTEQVQQRMNLAGSIELDVGSPLKTDACYVSFVAPGDSRPKVLQLQSYRAADREAFPSVFLQAQIDASSLADLVGQVVPARLFIQPEAQGPVLFSPVHTPVELKIVSLQDQVLSAELVGGSLWNATAGVPVTAAGKFTGVLP